MIFAASLRWRSSVLYQ